MDGDLTPPSMPLAHARDALADQVRLFCNDCIGRLEEASPDRWVKEFRAWQEFDNITARYERDMRELARHGA